MIIPIYDLLLLPGMSYPLTIKHIDKESLQHLIDRGEQFIAVPLKAQVSGTPENDDFYKIGAVLKPNAIKETKHGLQVMVDVASFAEVTNIVHDSSGLQGDVMVVYDDVDLDPQSRQEMIQYILTLVDEVSHLFKGNEEMIRLIHEFTDLNKMMGFMIQGMQVKPSEKYSLMETLSLKKTFFALY